MANVLDKFIDKKKAESQFVSLADGESIKVLKLKEIKMITKAGFGGEEKEVLRLVVDVETSEGVREKLFDNGTQRFAQELREKGVTDVGFAFTLTRHGLQTKTRYSISNVMGKDGTAVSSSEAPSAPSA
jgi:hypothetical protein